MTSACRVLGRAACGPVAAAALLVLAAGCAGRGDVSGKVTYKGKPLVWGTVQFEGSDNLIKQANIQSDGTFSIQGVAVGEAKAAVSSINPKSSDFQPRQAEGRPPPKPRPEVKGWFPIPEKYDAPYKSGLVYTIKPGPNAIDIVLE
jgi:hypothetical protein